MVPSLIYIFFTSQRTYRTYTLQTSKYNLFITVCHDLEPLLSYNKVTTFNVNKINIYYMQYIAIL